MSLRYQRIGLTGAKLCRGVSDMLTTELAINIYINDRHYASRRWRVVPSIGDCIKLNGPKEGVYEISKIMWGGDEFPYVNLVVVNAPEEKWR